MTETNDDPPLWATWLAATSIEQTGEPSQRIYGSNADADYDNSQWSDTVSMISQHGNDSWFTIVPGVLPDDIDSELEAQDDRQRQALRHIIEHFLPTDHGKCLSIIDLEPQNRFDVMRARFEDGWSCMTWLLRDRKEDAAVLESEIETMRYVRDYTNIPIPEVLYVDHSPDGVVGAAFVVVENIPGVKIEKIWGLLNEDSRQVVISQIAGVMAELASLRFPSMGSIDGRGLLGPMLRRGLDKDFAGCSIYGNVKEYASEVLKNIGTQQHGMRPALLTAIDDTLAALLDLGSDHPPEQVFRLVHGNLRSSDFWFNYDRSTGAIDLTAVVGWEYSWTAPLVFLSQHPPFLQDRHRVYINDFDNVYSNGEYFRRFLTAKLHDHATLRECLSSQSAGLIEFDRCLVQQQMPRGRVVASLERLLEQLSAELIERNPRMTRTASRTMSRLGISSPDSQRSAGSRLKTKVLHRLLCGRAQSDDDQDD